MVFIRSDVCRVHSAVVLSGVYLKMEGETPVLNEALALDKECFRKL